MIVTSMTADDLESVRAIAQPFPEAQLTLHGAFRRHVHHAPGFGDVPGVDVVTYLPCEARRPLPVLLHFHGGGMIAGTADADTPAMIELAAQAGYAFATVEYRLAPEHPYPAALADAATALAWMSSGAAPGVLDPDRIVAESPGGVRVLYVALTRATQRLVTFDIDEPGAWRAPLGASALGENRH